MNEPQDAPAPGFDPEQPLIGHEMLTSALARSMAGGRVAHGWLLTGPAGSGKGLMARLAAAWMLAEDRNANAGLDLGGETGFALDRDDPGTGLVMRSVHPDLMIVEPDSEDNKSGQIKLAQIRKLLSFMGRKPARDGWRVAVIDSMDDVNRNGANALLKLLEEPPAKTILFLTASRPGRLPPTIRSRCRVVRIVAPDSTACSQILDDRLASGGMPHTELARLADGAPGRALKLAESGAADCYMAVCSLLAAPTLDQPALSAMCTKWGKGGSDGATLRDGAIWLIARLLRLCALHANTGTLAEACAFEANAIKQISVSRDAAAWATAHAAFLGAARQADGLYLDFAHFLLRELTNFHRKTLP